MDIKDLMIGDWVTYTNKYMSSVLLCEVVAVNNPSGEVILRNLQSNKIDEFGNKDYKVITTRYEYIHHIPLTAEILEKNGWYFGLTSNEEDLKSVSPAHFVSHWAYDEGGGEISLFFPNESDGGCLRICDQKFNRSLEFVYCDTIYVHELQNALRLCGMNELANNFKV